MDTETLYYIEDSEEWLTIVSNESLQQEVFTQKKKLTLKPKTSEDLNLLNVEEDEAPAVTVDEMLAAAEGATEATKHVKERVRLREKAAGLYSGDRIDHADKSFNAMFTNYGVITRGDRRRGLHGPFSVPLLIVELFDLAISVFLFLSITEIFPCFEFGLPWRMGYFSFFHWGEWHTGDHNSFDLMVTPVAGSIVIFICTLTRDFFLMVVSGLLGILGMGGYA